MSPWDNDNGMLNTSSRYHIRMAPLARIQTQATLTSKLFETALAITPQAKALVWV